MSGTEKAQENLLTALAHNDDRVRRAALAELKRLNEPRTAERLLELVLAECPRGSPKVRKRRWLALTVGRGLGMAPLIAIPMLFKQSGPVIYAVTLVSIVLLFAALEVWLLAGRNKLWSAAQRDILQCIGELASQSPTALREKLPELRALGTGWHGTQMVRKAARDAVQSIEAASEQVRELPVVTDDAGGLGKDLPIPAQPFR